MCISALYTFLHLKKLYSHFVVHSFYSIFPPFLSPKTTPFVLQQQFCCCPIPIFLLFFYASPTLFVPLFFAFVSIFFQKRLAFFALKKLPFLSPKLLGFLNAIPFTVFRFLPIKKCKTLFLSIKNPLFARQKPYFCNAKTTLLFCENVTFR